MKLIPLREFEGLKSVDVIKAVIEKPVQGATVDWIRSGVRILDAVEKNADPTGLQLEDADHAALAKAVNGYTFGMVSKNLLTIIDDVLNAKEPPSAEKAAEAA